MALATRRVRQAGLIGPLPVARTATTVAAAAVVAHGIGQRAGFGKTAAMRGQTGGPEPKRTRSEGSTEREGPAMGWEVRTSARQAR